MRHGHGTRRNARGLVRAGVGHQNCVLACVQWAVQFHFFPLLPSQQRFIEHTQITLCNYTCPSLLFSTLKRVARLCTSFTLQQTGNTRTHASRVLQPLALSRFMPQALHPRITHAPSRLMRCICLRHLRHALNPPAPTYAQCGTPTRASTRHALHPTHCCSPQHGPSSRHKPLLQSWWMHQEPKLLLIRASEVH